MHVLFEGIFPLHVEQLLRYVIEVSGIMTLEQINSRISEFPYAYFNNKPGLLNGFDPRNSQTGMAFYHAYYIECIIMLCLSCSCSNVGTAEYITFYSRQKFVIK